MKCLKCNQDAVRIPIRSGVSQTFRNMEGNQERIVCLFPSEQTPYCTYHHKVILKLMTPTMEVSR